MMEQLASFGFVVIALSHPGESVMTPFADGSAVPIDPQLENAMKLLLNVDEGAIERFLHAVNKQKSADTLEEGFAASREVSGAYTGMLGSLAVPFEDLVHARQEHFRRVVDWLNTANANEKHPLHGVADASRLGALGHSLGGYSALRFALHHPDEIAAVASLDAPYFVFDDDKQQALRPPSLSLYAEGTTFPGGKVAKIAGINGFLGAPTKMIEWEVQGAAHMNFTDMNYLPQGLKLVGLIGDIPGERAASLSDRAITGFFREHLRKEPSDWQSGVLGSFPEVIDVSAK